MNGHDWTLGSFLFWLAIAVAVPAIIAHFTVGRRGGHHLFDRDGLSDEEIRQLPFTMFKRRTIRSLRGSAAVAVGIAAALALYPLGCLLGIPINVFGMSDQALMFCVAGAVVLAITLGPALYRRRRDE
jgi:hypothetical protein